MHISAHAFLCVCVRLSAFWVIEKLPDLETLFIIARFRKLLCSSQRRSWTLRTECSTSCCAATPLDLKPFNLQASTAGKQPGSHRCFCNCPYLRCTHYPCCTFSGHLRCGLHLRLRSSKPKPCLVNDRPFVCHLSATNSHHFDTNMWNVSAQKFLP